MPSWERQCFALVPPNKSLIVHPEGQRLNRRSELLSAILSVGQSWSDNYMQLCFKAAGLLCISTDRNVLNFHLILSSSMQWQFQTDFSSLFTWMMRLIYMGIEFVLYIKIPVLFHTYWLFPLLPPLVLYSMKSCCAHVTPFINLGR